MLCLNGPFPFVRGGKHKPTATTWPTLLQVARRLGVSRGTARNMAIRGELRYAAIPLPNSDPILLIDPKSVREYVGRSRAWVSPMLAAEWETCPECSPFWSANPR